LLLSGCDSEMDAATRHTPHLKGPNKLLVCARRKLIRNTLRPAQPIPDRPISRSPRSHFPLRPIRGGSAPRILDFRRRAYGGDPPSRSGGLRTPLPPRFGTCVSILDVLTSA